MTGKVYDRNPLIVDRSPLKQLAVEVGKFPPLDPLKVVGQLLERIIDFVEQWPVLGDLIAPFLEGIRGLIDGNPEAMVTFLTDPIAWARRILRFVVEFARGIPGLGQLIAPFLDAIDDLLIDNPATMLDFLTNPIAWSKRILRFLVGFARGIPVLGDLIAPFLDALDDLIDDIPETMLDFLDPIAWAKRLLRFSAQFVRSVPVLGPKIAPFVDAVEAMANDIPEPMLDLLNPIVWAQWVLDGLYDVTGLDLRWLGDFTGGLAGGGGLSDWVSGLLGFGYASSGIPVVGTGQVGSSPMNLLINPLFATANAFLGGMGISWDGSQSHSATGGSARFDVTGNTMSLVGNAIAVIPGDILDLSIWTKWDGLSAGGAAPISLMLEAYDAFDNLIPSASQIISGVVSPGAASGWIPLAGSYEVDDPLVKTIAPRFNVTNLVTAGTVWFDDGGVFKPNLVLPTDILGPLPGVGNLADDWDELLVTLGGPTLTDLINRFQNINGAGQLNAASLYNITNIPVILQNRVTGLVADLADRLRISGTNGADDFDRLMGAFNATTSLSSTASTLNTDFRDLMAEVIDSTFTLANTTTKGIYNTQSVLILANYAVTPIDAVMQNVDDWWNAEDWTWW